MPGHLVFLVDKEKVRRTVERVLWRMTTAGKTGTVCLPESNIEHLWQLLSTYKDRALVTTYLRQMLSKEPARAEIANAMMTPLWRLRIKPTIAQIREFHVARTSRSGDRVLGSPTSSSRSDDSFGSS